MKQYEVIESFELDGELKEVGSIVELSEEVAGGLSEKLKEVVNSASGETPSTENVGTQDMPTTDAPVEPSSETPTDAPEPTQIAENASEEPKGDWAGNHKV